MILPENGALPTPAPKYAAIEDADTGEILLTVWEKGHFAPIYRRPTADDLKVICEVLNGEYDHELKKAKERARVAEARAYRLQYNESAKIQDLYRQLKYTQEEVAWREREIERLVKENARYYAEVCELPEETQASISEVLNAAMRGRGTAINQAPVSSIFPTVHPAT